jgi:hypothetical protein
MHLGRRLLAATMAMAAGFGLDAAEAQSVPEPTPAFDAASIKPAKPGARGYSIRPLPGKGQR